MNKNTILLWDIQRILKNNLRKLFWVSIIIGFLFFLFNIFFGLSNKFSYINNIITDKIGIYFYINESVNHDETYKRIINIKDELFSNGIDSNFSSKNDAFNFLENKIPEITKNFDKFGIDNPLPSTLYVMFDNKKEYNIMKDIIIKNKDIILNIKDIEKWATLQQQENRSLRILKIIEIIKNVLYSLVIIVSIILITFTQHLLTNFFYEFYKELQIKKLLWATHKDTNLWFILTLLSVITLGFIFWFILTLIILYFLENNLATISINLELYNILPKIAISYVIFSLIAIWLWYNKLNILEKKF